MQLQCPQESDRLCKVLALVFFIMLMMAITVVRDGDDGDDENGDHVLSYNSPLQGA